MVSPKKLIKMVRKWEKATAPGSKKIAHPGVNVEVNSSLTPEKGHFVIYTTDGGHFTIPLQCLCSNIFQELFKMSKEEFVLGRPEDNVLFNQGNVRGDNSNQQHPNLRKFYSFISGKVYISIVQLHFLTSCTITVLKISPLYQESGTVLTLIRKSSLFGPQSILISILHMYDNTISTKKLLKVARKWQKIAAIGRKRISHPRTRRPSNADDCRMLEVNKKGHFIICSTDRRRFVIPLACLNTHIFQELFKPSEEDDGPIILPFDAAIVEYTVLLTKGGLTEDLQRALPNLISSWSCSSYDSMIKAV
ncbi:hypothetical protein BT93_E0561 [Corymbia citriodora subsp. variegata]|nr:hypothetical protein BT93_E0561 [Corymbia citriodora subsp. variegata]